MSTRSASVLSGENISATTFTANLVMTATEHVIVNSGCWKVGGTTISSVSDASNGTYTVATSKSTSDTDFATIDQRYKNNIGTGGTITITVTPATGCNGGFVAESWSGVKTTPTVTTNSTNGSSTTVSSSAVAPSANSLYSACGAYNTGGPSTFGAVTGGYSNTLKFDENNDAQDVIVSSKSAVSGSQTATWTISNTGTWAGLNVAYEEAGGETVTIDKWYRKAEEPARRRFVAVPY